MNRHLAATLAVLAGVAAAEEQPFTFTDPPKATSPAVGGNGVAGPGTALPVGARGNPTTAGGGNRQVFLRGLVDLDYISQTNYQDGNNDLADHRDNGLIRTELGARVELDERVEAQITVAYQSETGGTQFVPGSRTRTDSSSPVVLDDGYVVLKDFFEQPELSVKAGRMPEVWNLRTDFGGFLYDSREDYHAVTSWDGVRARYNLDTITLTPYAYHLPDDAQLFGIAVDWQPEEGQGNNLFVTGSANIERHPVLPAMTTTAYQADLVTTGKSLFTYYGGIEAKFDVGFDLWGEGALQTGKVDADTTFAGYGFSAGLDWRAPTVTQFALGVQIDYLSGDDKPTDNRDRAFINTHEGVSDTYIVESEKYGEVSRYVQNRFGLEAGKVRMEIGLPPDNKFRFKAVYGYYRIPTDVGARDLGHEFDLTATWQYTYNATFNLFGALLLPRDGFDQVAPAGPLASSTDDIWLLGVNLQVAF